MIDLIGWVGAAALAVCALPAAWEAWHKKSCTYNSQFLYLWFFGEVLLCLYAMATYQYHLLLNYSINIAAVWILLTYNKGGD